MRLSGTILVVAVLCLTQVLTLGNALRWNRGCFSDSDCRNQDAPLCLRVSRTEPGRCVGCRGSSDCTTKDRSFCGECNYCQTPLPGIRCLNSDDCGRFTPVCDLRTARTGTCTECVADETCLKQYGNVKSVCGKCGVCEVAQRIFPSPAIGV